MNECYYGYLYEIIIPTLKGEKHYYGKKEYDHRHDSSKCIYENYWGSGVFVKDWFLCHTNGTYTSRMCPKEIAINLGVKRIIHGYFKTKDGLCCAEIQLISVHLGKEYCVNMAKGGTGGNVGHYVCTESTRQKKRLNNLGLRMWTNGIINKRSKDCPGDGWHIGTTLSKEEIEKRRNRLKNMVRKPFTKAQYENLKKANLLNQKRVKCIELNVIFNSLKDAQCFFGVTYNKIMKCCRDKNLTWKGYHWEYI